MKMEALTCQRENGREVQSGEGLNRIWLYLKHFHVQPVLGPALCCEVGRTDLTVAVTGVCRDNPVWKVEWLLWGDPESNTGFYLLN